jgi:hypothetical protein
MWCSFWVVFSVRPDGLRDAAPKNIPTHPWGTHHPEQESTAGQVRSTQYFAQHAARTLARGAANDAFSHFPGTYRLVVTAQRSTTSREFY